MSQTNISNGVNGSLSTHNVPSQPHANIGLTDILSFCYDLSETDIKVLQLLAKADIKKADDLIRDLNISRAAINRSLNKLLETGLIMRIKEPGNRVGRPRYQYKLINGIKEKILKDIRDCAERVTKLIEQTCPSQ